ncbi:MAG: hypothetical protein ACTTH0_04815 [Eubacteriales bacterium]
MRGASKSKLFLMEFIFVVLMFAVCATICVTVFAKSDQFSRLASATNEGTLIAATAIEQVKSIESKDENRIKTEVEKIEKEINEKYVNKYNIKIEYKISDGILIGSCKVKNSVLGDVCELPLAKYAGKV